MLMLHAMCQMCCSVVNEDVLLVTVFVLIKKAVAVLCFISCPHNRHREREAACCVRE